MTAHLGAQIFDIPQHDHQSITGNDSAVLTDEQTNHSLFNGQQTRKRAMDKAEQIQAAKQNKQTRKTTHRYNLFKKINQTAATHIWLQI
eukprot:9068459-Heterocapsa_arctica.AAC.1